MISQYINEKKICFIACVDDEAYEEEMLKYINRLNVPAGFELDYLAVKDACSMCSGYNEAMLSSDAKYKIYLHQDTFIVEKDFLNIMLKIFEDKTVGMIGLVGSPVLPEDCVMWHGPRVGKVYYSSYYKAGKNENVGEAYNAALGDLEAGCEGSGAWEITDAQAVDVRAVDVSAVDVQAVDGFLIATQVDLAWRDDLFGYWDFYDISQSAEMIRAGYRIVVPKQDKPFCLHDDAFMNLGHYEESRLIYKEEYGQKIEDAEAEINQSDSGEDIIKKRLKAGVSDDGLNHESRYKNLKDDDLTAKKNEINTLLGRGTEAAWQKISELLSDENWFTPVRETDDFAALFIASQIYAENKISKENDKTDKNKERSGRREEKCGIRLQNDSNEIWLSCTCLQDVKNTLFILRMIFFHLVFIYDDSAVEEFVNLWKECPSLSMIWKIIVCMVPKPVIAAERTAEIFRVMECEQEYKKMLVLKEWLRIADHIK